MGSSPKNVTQMLIDWGDGNQAVLAELMPVVYEELRQLAEQYLRRERPDHTLQATALVHEAYLRLVDQTQVRWQNRTQFFGMAAHLMRQILVDHARAHLADKRGGGARRLSLDEAVEGVDERAADLLALDDALTDLAKLDPQKSRLVELRFFGGLTVEETAQVMGLPSITVHRGWRVAKAWLHDQIRPGGRHDA